MVDDIEEQRIIAARMLAKLGYEVATVDCGQAAVDYVQDNSPELIVLDMIMEPGIDGLETYKRISAKRPGQKVVIASGYAETGRVETLQDLSAGVYLKKPYSLEQLGLAVKSSLATSCPGDGRC